jgi:hypothetical protein
MLCPTLDYSRRDIQETKGGSSPKDQDGLTPDHSKEVRCLGTRDSISPTNLGHGSETLG